MARVRVNGHVPHTDSNLPIHPIEGETYMQGICHRDIKPNNILIGQNNVLKVCDFGVSKRVQEIKTLHTLRGTEVYMSPQLKLSLQLQQGHTVHDPYRSDVYSLGLVFLCMARLVQPFELMTPNERLEKNTVKAISQVPYSEPIKNLLSLMLRSDERDRPDFVELEKRIDLSKAVLAFNISYREMQVSQVTQVLEPLKQLIGEDVQMTITLEVPCAKCNQILDLAAHKKKILFCSCGKHSYCSEICYSESQQNVHETETTDECAALCPLVPKSKSEAQCLFCASNVVQAAEAGRTYIQLYCNPQEHMFCSLNCFVKFVQERCPEKKSSGEQIKCPKCDVKISEDLLIEIFGTKERFYKQIKRECMHCKLKRFKFLSDCGHAFCSHCCKELLSVMHLGNTNTVTCFLCENMLSAKQINKSLSIKKRIISLFNFMKS